MSKQVGKFECDVDVGSPLWISVSMNDGQNMLRFTNKDFADFKHVVKSLEVMLKKRYGDNFDQETFGG